MGAVKKPADLKPIHRILIDEIRLLRKRRAEAATPGDPRIGIALSGGGIRSAIFNLGLLTELERAGFLRMADYLSTVSGGGYIGSYVIANRLKGHDVADDSPGNPALDHLRKFGNYLTPSVGAMSADTWTMMMVWFRNTSMLQLFLLSVFAVVLLLPRFWGLLLSESVGNPMVQEWAVPASVLIFHLMVAGICSILVRGYQGVGGFTAPPRPQAGKLNASEIRWMLTVVIVLALSGSTLFAVGAFVPFARGGALMRELETVFSMTLGTCGFYLALSSLGYARGFWQRRYAGAGWVFAFAFVGISTMICAGLPPFGGLPAALRLTCSVALAAGLLGLGGKFVYRVEDQEAGKDIGRSVLAGLACGAVSFAGLQVAESLHGDSAYRALLLMNSRGLGLASADIWKYAIFAAPGLLATLGCCIIVLIGVAGRAMPDLVREAWSRLGALLYMKSVGLLLVGLIGVYGPLAILTAWVSWNSYVLASGGVATAALGVLSLMAAHDGSTGNREKGGGGKREILAKAGPPLFIVLLFCFVAMALHMVFVGAALAGGAEHCRMVPSVAKFEHCEACVGLGARPDKVTVEARFVDCPSCGKGYWSGPGWPRPEDLSRFHWQFLDASIHSLWPMVVWMLAGLAVVALFLMGRLDLNEYSINRFYRNRLARCFIGAARAEERMPNPMTGFDMNDDVQMAVVSQFVKANAATPIPILNTTLNAVGGTNAVMEERRAESFFVTPDAAYSDSTGSLDMRKFATGRLPGDVTLGSLVAISGAAANPNMGFHTSTTIAFLLTFFNVRLGWWAGIPQKLRWYKQQFNLAYVFFELFGAADTDDAYVNLSDGGHFENLGIYELVRRRCKLIVVGDGEQDERYVFESLGGAIRKCRIDFGVEIAIDVSKVQPTTPGGLNGLHFAVGEIRYPKGQRGYLVYVKSSFTGREPYDVKQYWYGNPQFPQQSTGDQFFDESQFESYRQIGKHAGEELMAALQCAGVRTRRDWVRAARGLWRNGR